MRVPDSPPAAIAGDCRFRNVADLARTRQAPEAAIGGKAQAAEGFQRRPGIGEVLQQHDVPDGRARASFAA